MKDHSFPECAINAFVETGDWDFYNPISSQPWSVRSRVIAKQRIYEKYLTTEDVMKAAWLQKQANQLPRTDDSQYTGCAYMRSLLIERSEGLYLKEIEARQESLPGVMDYAQDAWGKLPEPEPEPAVKLTLMKGRD